MVVRAVALDGAHVWLTLEAPSAGSIVAIDRRSRERTPFSSLVPRGAQTVTLRLAELPGEDERTFDLVFTSHDRDRTLGRAEGGNRPTVAPLSPDGRWHVRVVARPSGLALRRKAAFERVTVASIGLVDDHLVVSWPAAAGVELQLVRGDGNVVEVGDLVDVAGDVASARLPADLPVSVGDRWDLVVRSGGAVLPLGRAQNDLRHPNLAVVLPELHTGDASLRLRWSNAGTLQVRRRSLR